MTINPVKSAPLPVRVALPSTIQGEGVTVDALCRRWGFRVFGAAGEGLMWVALPAGWRLDNMRLDYVWQSIKDDKGRLRATMEYFSVRGKRHALLTVIPRFEAYAKATGYVVVVDNATGQTIYSISAIKQQGEDAILRARDWMANHYPEYLNAMAYWEHSFAQPSATACALEAHA